MYFVKYALIVVVAVLSAATAAVVMSSQHLSTYRSLKAHRVIATWDQAQHTCASEGGNLASPVTEEMLSDMQHLIKANSHDNKYFIGARVRLVHGLYVSVEGIALEDMPVFDMLDRLDPAEGDCLSIDENKISVVSCWTPLPFICHWNTTITNDTMTDSVILSGTILEPVSNVPVLNETVSHVPVLNETVSNVPVLNETVSHVPVLNVPVLNGTASNVPLMNGTVSNVPLMNGTVSNVPLMNGTASNVPVLNETVSNVPVLNETVSNVPLLNETVLNNTKERGCPTEGFIRIESSGKCYKHYIEEKPWRQAEASCVEQGAHLLVLRDEHEARDLLENIRSINLEIYGVWTGLRDMSGEGDWRGIDGTPVEQLYNKWYYGTKRRNSGLVELSYGKFLPLNRNLDARNGRFGLHYVCEQPFE